MEVIGQTIDDAAGEAFDKCAKVMGLGYPGGPIVNKLANEGDPKAFTFSKPHIPGYDYSFSGLKTSFLYTLRDKLQEDPDFIEKNKKDLCASLQATVIDILMDKLRKAVKAFGINQVALSGGVSANSGLRDAFLDHEGTEVLAPSTIAMTLQGGNVLGANPKVTKMSKTSVDKVIPSPIYKKSEVKDNYNEMTLTFKGNYSLIFRLYNEGLAYRFCTAMAKLRATL